MLGALAESHPDYTLIKNLAYLIAEGANARIGYLPRAANSVGAYVAGALPHGAPGARAAGNAGLNALDMLGESLKVFVLWGVEPDRDLIDPALAMRALGQADLVVACSAFRSPSLEATADVLLPIAAFAETSGTYVNAGGQWQRFQGAVAPPGDARPGWKVLRVLGNLTDLAGFEYGSGLQVHDELAALCTDIAPNNSPRGKFADVAPRSTAEDLARVGNVPIYAVDALVRAAPSLQHTPLADRFRLSLHPEQAAALGLRDGDEVDVRQGDATARTRVVLDDRIPPGVGRVPAAVDGSETLGPQIGPMTVEKVG
jgi:NADH-quinone oxidoreductase subunit G